MPFLDLHEFVQGQFAAFSGLDEYERQLTIWVHMQRSQRREESARYYQRHKQTIKAKTPEANRAHQAAWRARNPELARQRTREATRRWRAAKRAAKSTAQQQAA